MVAVPEEINPTKAEAAKVIMESIKNKTHLSGLVKEGSEPVNMLNMPEFIDQIIYEDDDKRNLVRTKDGLIVLKRVPMMKIQAGIASSVLKQVAKKLVTGQLLTGLDLPIQIFEPRTYLQQY